MKILETAPDIDQFFMVVCFSGLMIFMIFLMKFVVFNDDVDDDVGNNDDDYVDHWN